MQLAQFRGDHGHLTGIAQPVRHLLDVGDELLQLLCLPAHHLDQLVHDAEQFIDFSHVKSSLCGH